MKRRLATNHDIANLRALAAQGVFLTAAARRLGMRESSVRYWNVKEHIGLIGCAQDTRFDYTHPAPDIYACWRLQKTMQRLSDALTQPSA